MDKSKRYYRWSCVTYLSPDLFKLVFSQTVHWAYIYHDKDDNEKHYHLLLVFRHRKSFNAVLSLFDSSQNTLIEPMHDKEACYRYLTHEGTDKALYSGDSIVCDDKTYWTSEISDTSANDEFLSDLRSKSFTELASIYGRDFIRNSRAYLRFRRIMEFESSFTLCGSVRDYVLTHCADCFAFCNLDQITQCMKLSRLSDCPISSPTLNGLSLEPVDSSDDLPF